MIVKKFRTGQISLCTSKGLAIPIGGGVGVSQGGPWETRAAGGGGGVCDTLAPPSPRFALSLDRRPVVTTPVLLPANTPVSSVAGVAPSATAAAFTAVISDVGGGLDSVDGSGAVVAAATAVSETAPSAASQTAPGSSFDVAVAVPAEGLTLTVAFIGLERTAVFCDSVAFWSPAGRSPTLNSQSRAYPSVEDLFLK